MAQPHLTRARRLKRILALSIVVAQLALVVRAYSADHAFFGFQMFPESSEWMATIERVEGDGTRADIREPWPGGYHWEGLVTGRGLDRPFSRNHADTGLDSTLHFFAEALYWVAHNTPDDSETVRLVAKVTTWHNGNAPTTRTITVER